MTMFSDFKKSYIVVGKEQIPIIYKPEVHYSKSAQYDEAEILGRSSPLLGYRVSGSKTMSITVRLVADGTHIKTTQQIKRYAKILESSVYPYYSGGGIKPPDIVIIKVENIIKLFGVITSVSVAVPNESPWDMDNGLPYMLDITLEFTEVRNIPLSAPEVRRGN